MVLRTLAWVVVFLIVTGLIYAGIRMWMPTSPVVNTPFENAPPIPVQTTPDPGYQLPAGVTDLKG